MAIPKNKELYAKVKKMADEIYKKSSAYKSGYIVRKYKELGGEYIDNGNKNLKRWFQEKWVDVGKKEYPVYRPSVKVSKTKTPLTVAEIDKAQLKQQIALKQKIKGAKNLPPFKKK